MIVLSMFPSSDEHLAGFCEVKIQQHKWPNRSICGHPEFPGSVTER